MKIENIKFKAKSTLDGAWVQGDLVHNENGTIDILRNCLYLSEVDPSTVCQYTGLTDCEGKELFEHDLIHFVGYKPIGEVIWSEENYAFMVVSGNEPLYWLSEVLEIGKIERVGNKFDNEKQCMRLKKKEKLTAYWDKKENCIGAYHPLGFMTQTDAHYLFDKVLTKEFVKEMTDRGYDVTTMKFEISPKLPNYERFNGLSEKYYGKKQQRMKNKILNLIKSAVWFVLCLFVGALIFEGIRSLANSNEPAKKIGMSVFTEEGHDYLVVDTKHGVCVVHAESCPCRKKKQRMENNMFEDIVAEGNIVVIDNYWIVLCKRWRPECYNLFCYLYLHKEAKNLMVGSHFTMTEDKKKSTRLATNEERLMLFEEMFKYGIAFDKHDHHLIGKLW